MKYLSGILRTCMSFALSLVHNLFPLYSKALFTYIYKIHFLFGKLNLVFNLQSTFLLFFLIDSVSITDVLVLFAQLIYCSPSYPKTALAAHTGKFFFSLYANVFIYSETFDNFFCNFLFVSIISAVLFFPSTLTLSSSFYIESGLNKINNNSGATA